MATESDYPLYLDISVEDGTYMMRNLSIFDLKKSRPIEPGEAIAIAMSTLALIFNILALLSITHVKGHLSTNLRLITSLTLSDMLVGTAYMIKVTKRAVSPVFHSIFTQCLEHVTHALITSAHIIVLLNLLGLAVDHFCAIVKPLGYPVLMSHRRVNMMIMSFWSGAFLIGFSRFIMPVTIYYHCKQYASYQSYCEYVECSRYDPEYAMYCVVLIAFTSMACLYTRIFIKIRTYQRMQGRHKKHHKPNTKGLLTTVLIVASFALLWIPYCIFTTYIHVGLIRFPMEAINYFKIKKEAEYYLYDLVLLNSMFDPVIYAVRMRDVRQGFSRFQKRFRKNERRKLSQTSTLENRTLNTNSAVTLSLKNDFNNGEADVNQNSNEV